METELQTLKKEIDELRNENIALYNELVKQNKILFEQIISIGKELANQQNTVYQAIKNAEFILDKVPGIRLIENKNEYLKYVFDKTDVSGGGDLSGVRRL
ncbi:MAG: hypothetical protein IJK81_00230 [Selenomonadaceae bacterium]|nr:hypothetical protein [Selenomonadaceae bacterium]